MWSEILKTIAVIVVTYIAKFFIGTHECFRGVHRNVIQKQLDNVYTPIIKYKKNQCPQEESHWVNFAYLLFHENIEITDCDLLELCETVYYSPHETSVANLFEIINTRYNWCKRCLAYPYDPEAIKKKQLCHYGKYSMYMDIIYVFLISTPILLFLFFTTYIDESPSDKFAIFGGLISVYIILFLLALIIVRFLPIETRKK